MRSITSFTANDKVPANPRSLPPVLENFHRAVSPHILLAQKFYWKKAKETVIRKSRRTQSALKREELNEGYFLTIFSAVGSRSELGSIKDSNQHMQSILLSSNSGYFR